MGENWPAENMSGGRYTQSDSAGGSTGGDADWGVLDGVHIRATWRIRLNCPCARGGDAALCQITLTTCFLALRRVLRSGDCVWFGVRHGTIGG